MKRNVTRRDFIKAGAGGLCALALGSRLALGAEGAAQKRPNILVITTDQQQAGMTSALGCKWVKTPNIDSIAASGVYFTKSYCPYPLCSPSRSSLHTGRTPHEIRVDRNSVSIDPAVTLSGQVFQAAGYETAYSGKWHMPNPYPSDGIAGFNVLNKGTRQGKLAHDVDTQTVEQGIEFLKRKHDKPFYLVVSLINPHDICLLAGESSPLFEEVRKRYFPPEGAELPPLPENFRFIPNEPGPIARRRQSGGSHEAWDETQWRKYRYAYHRLVEDADQSIGRVLAALRETGQEENTLIVFTSDHGEGMGAHHWTGKMMFYEEEASVPLIVSWKGVTPAGRVDKEHLVTALDVLPTICDYAGLQPPEKMRGASLKPLIEKPEQQGHVFVASEMTLPGGAGGPIRTFMIRTQKYKYIDFPGVEHPEMLFDMEADPGELSNLAGQDAFAAELGRHRMLLALWRKVTEEEQYPPQAAPGGGGGKKKARRQGKKKMQAQAAEAQPVGRKKAGGKKRQAANQQ